MLREDPAARTLRSMDLPDDQWQDISWRNALRWLGREQDAGLVDAALSGPFRRVERG
jgi:hypothetical protein